MLSWEGQLKSRLFGSEQNDEWSDCLLMSFVDFDFKKNEQFSTFFLILKIFLKKNLKCNLIHSALKKF